METNIFGKGKAMGKFRWLVLGVLVAMLLVGTVGASYGYVTTLTINSSAALTNYQMDFTLSNATGTSTGGTLYTDGHTRADWADISFTDGTGLIPLSFWLREGTATATTQPVTVLIPSIASDNTTTIKLYYGDAAVSTSLSNGTAVFPFFDDFNNGTTLDTTKWYTNATPTVAGGVVTIISSGGSDTGIMSITPVSLNPGTVETRMKSKHFGVTYKEGIYFRRTSATDLVSLMYSHSLMTYAMKAYQVKGGTGEANPVNITGWTADTYGIVKMESTGTLPYLTIDGSHTGTFYNATLYPVDAGRIWVLATTAANAEVDVDWIATRNYTSPSPTTSNYITVSNTGVTGGAYSFIHLSDLHLSLRTTPAMLNKTMSQIESLKSLYNISAVFITGDLTSSDEAGWEGQWQAFNRSLTLTTVPVYEVAGNHDFNTSGYDYAMWNTYVPSGASRHNYGVSVNDFAVYGLAWNGASTDYYNTVLNATAQTDMLEYFNASAPKIPIILNHAYMFQNGTLLTPIGHEILNNVTSDTIILSGHQYLANVPGRLNFTSANGYNVVEDLINYQGYTAGTALGGRIYTFDPTAATDNLQVGNITFYPDVEVQDGIATYTLNASAESGNPPVANFTADNTTVCVNDFVRFTDTSTGGIPTSWLWDFGSGTNTTQNASFRYTLAGLFDVNLTATNADGSNSSLKSNCSRGFHALLYYQ